MAKEEKKTMFGEKYLNALKGTPRIARDAVINAVNKDNDKRLQYAGENNTVDFNDALRRAKTTVDPFARTEASDDKDNPEYEKPVIGQRSIDWRIKKAQARLDREDASFRTALDEKILETEKDINLFMDEEETDILSSDGLMRGYSVVMQRTAVPEKAKSIDDLNVMLGGKKVSVFKELGPSLPKSIPTRRKRSKVGIPKRYVERRTLPMLPCLTSSSVSPKSCSCKDLSNPVKEPP